MTDIINSNYFNEPLALSGMSGLVAAIILGMAIGFTLVKSKLAFRKTVFDQLGMRDGTFFTTIFASLATGIILFYFASKTGMVRNNAGHTFFWAAEFGGIICALGIALCGLTPSTAIASLAAGRVYALWVFAGMLAAIPVIHLVKEFMADTIYKWPAPFTYQDFLPEFFSNSNFYLWAAGISAVLCLFFEFMPAGGEEKKD